MCGISGAIRFTEDAATLDRDEIVRTRDAMAARGPDGAGFWASRDGRAALAHRRLAIIDLSESAAQPMTSANGRHAIVFNGEVYNHSELRRELELDGASFRTRSDTEVLLELLARFGTAALPRLRGMFALAMWDGVERRLLLARDGDGIKPLYYSVTEGVLRFASQVRALEASGAVPGDIDFAGLAGFLVWGSVPEPLTIRRAVRALPAGHLLEVRDGRVGAPVPFAPPPADPGDVADALAGSVRAHLVADVPVGVFLSAGLDSALVAALARRASTAPIVSVTLAFDEYAGTPDDEAPLAREVARALGTDHREVRVRAPEDLWERAIAAMDQPSIDGFNSYLVSAAAREAGLKVALSGLGGDELFGSYPSFRDVPRWHRGAKMGALLPGAPFLWPGIARYLRPSAPKLRGLLRHGTSFEGAYLLRRGLYLPEELPALLGARVAQDALAEAAGAWARPDVNDEPDAWRRVQVLETSLYMRNQLLRDTDWASMAHSLEVRVPLVDAPLRGALARDGFAAPRAAGKAALVRRVAPGLPAALFERPKTGFSVPVTRWMRIPGAATSRGLGSRGLALEVLRTFGVELPVEKAA